MAAGAAPGQRLGAGLVRGLGWKQVELVGGGEGGRAYDPLTTLQPTAPPQEPFLAYLSALFRWVGQDR
jgi:hypothetical protein